MDRNERRERNDRKTSGRRRGPRAFVLLEVIAAVVILGIASAVFMRSFIQSMHASKKMDITMQAGLLAQSMLDTFDLFPPEDGESSGSFADDPQFGDAYAFYFWKLDVKEEEIEYEDISLEGAQRDLVPLKTIDLSVIYDDGRNRRFTPIHVVTYAMGIDPFSEMTRSSVHLF